VAEESLKQQTQDQTQQESGQTLGSFLTGGFGQVPEGGGGGGGLSVICTAMCRLGLLSKKALRDEYEALEKREPEFEITLMGYRKLATPVAEWMIRHDKKWSMPFVPLVKSAMRWTAKEARWYDHVWAVPASLCTVIGMREHDKKCTLLERIKVK